MMPKRFSIRSLIVFATFLTCCFAVNRASYQIDNTFGEEFYFKSYPALHIQQGWPLTHLSVEFHHRNFQVPMPDKVVKRLTNLNVTNHFALGANIVFAVLFSAAMTLISLSLWSRSTHRQRLLFAVLFGGCVFANLIWIPTAKSVFHLFIVEEFARPRFANVFQGIPIPFEKNQTLHESRGGFIAAPYNTFGDAKGLWAWPIRGGEHFQLSASRRLLINLLIGALLSVAVVWRMSQWHKRNEPQVDN